MAVDQPERSAETATAAVDQPDRPVAPFPLVKAYDEEKSMTHLITPVRRFLWALLVLGTAASIAANVAHAHPEWGPRIMAVAAPVALLAFTHLAGLWGRIRTSGATYYAILVATAAIAAGAARVSFAAVRDLAASYGYGPLDAALIPLMLDGGLAVTALALVVLGRIEAEAAAVEQPMHHPEQSPVHQADQSTAAAAPTPVHQPTAAAPEQQVHQVSVTAPEPVVQPGAPAVTSADTVVHQENETQPVHAAERPRLAAVHRTVAPEQDKTVQTPERVVHQRTTEAEHTPEVLPVHRSQAAAVVQAGASELPATRIAEVYARLDAGESQTAIAKAGIANKRTIAKLRTARDELTEPAEEPEPAFA